MTGKTTLARAEWVRVLNQLLLTKQKFNFLTKTHSLTFKYYNTFRINCCFSFVEPLSDDAEDTTRTNETRGNVPPTSPTQARWRNQTTEFLLLSARPIAQQRRYFWNFQEKPHHDLISIPYKQHKSLWSYRGELAKPCRSVQWRD